jgi:2-enoate reductase
MGDDKNVYPAEDVLLEKVDVGNSVVVVGGGLIGCETSLWLSEQNKTVTLIEALDKLLAVNGPLCHANSDMLGKLIPYNHINVITSARIKAYENGIVVCDTKTGEQQVVCDSVVLAVGYDSDKSLYEDIRFDVPGVYLLGDARKVSNIMYAIWEAFEVANNI